MWPWTVGIKSLQAIGILVRVHNLKVVLSTILVHICVIFFKTTRVVVFPFIIPLVILVFPNILGWSANRLHRLVILWCLNAHIVLPCII